MNADAEGIVHRSAWLFAVRYAWLGIVLLAVVWLLGSHVEEIAQIASGYSASSLVAALACLVCGKFLVLLQMQLSISVFGHRLPMHEAAYVYSSSDLSKYLPGGFWGLVGRAALYRVRGIGARDLALALILENLWLVAGAFAVGLALSWDTLARLVGGAPSPGVRPTSVVAPVVVLSAVALLCGNVTACWVAKCRPSLLRHLQVIVIQCLTWVFFGWSFALLIPVAASDAAFLTVLGSYALAFGASLLSVFAPAGIGVREAVVLTLLQGVLPIDVVIVAALANRLLSVGADVTFAAMAFFVHFYLRSAKR